MKFAVTILVAFVAIASVSANQKPLLTNQQKNQAKDIVQEATIKTTNRLQQEANAIGLKINIGQTFNKLLKHYAPKANKAVNDRVAKFRTENQEEIAQVAEDQRLTFGDIRVRAINASKQSLKKVNNEDAKRILGELRQLAIDNSKKFAKGGKHGKKLPANFAKGQVNAQIKKNQQKINEKLNEGQSYVGKF